MGDPAPIEAVIAHPFLGLFHASNEVVQQRRVDAIRAHIGKGLVVWPKVVEHMQAYRAQGWRRELKHVLLWAR